jgi:hypothetical protein
MKLYSVKLSGYKRFADASINLESKVIGVVGPNEAGKSSLLAALVLLSDDKPIPTTAVTRGLKLTPEHEVMRARFRLTEQERALAPWKLSDNEAIWLFVAKTVGGPRRFYFDPPISRSRAALEAGASALQEVLEAAWFKEWQAANQQAVAPVVALPEAMHREGESLEAPVLKALSQVITVLNSFSKEAKARGAQEAAQALARTLGKVRDVESLQSPEQFAESLKDSVPQFLLFGESDRTLQSEFNLDKPPAPRVAWDNLARMAKVDLRALRTAIKTSDSGGIQTQMQGARRTLQKALKDGWKQSDLGISFDREGVVLRITVTSDDPDADAQPLYFALHDRSDGVRTFIALRAFLARRKLPVRPILLVDEAESHLHYDAQADLVRLFDEQREVEQVIYNTHSVGCLPSDLGRGVRVVVPDKTKSRSTIDNFWCQENAGVTPLMLAMGAATVPLTPSRYVVVTEGPSEALLLPTLIREATDQRSLPYQIVSGLARSSVPELQRLTREAPRVAFLADGDAAGAKHVARLAKARIADDKVIRLAAGLCLEDLVNPALYARAVDEYLRSWPPHEGGFSAKDLPALGRPDAVRAWCIRKKIQPASKHRVAETILRIMDQEDAPLDQRWGDPARVDELNRLHAALLSSFGL